MELDYGRRGALKGALKGALDEGGDEGATIGSARVHILRRVDQRRRRGLGRRGDRCGVDGAAVQHRFRFDETPRPVAGADDADMRVDRPALLVLVVEQRNAGEREIAAPPGELLE